MSISSDTLVTGGTGFLGRWLLIALTRRGRRVAVLARNARARGEELRAFVDARGGDGSRLELVDGDLSTEGLGIEEALPEVRDVYHLAAAFAFGMKVEKAKVVNVEGTRRVLAWARDRPALRRFIHLGGYRATRLPSWLEGVGFPLDESISRRMYREMGAYEASKLESHLAVRASDLPITIVNPSTVIGDSRTGETMQVTGMGETVQRLYEGTLPALGGTPRTNVPLVSVDHVADVLATAPERHETLGEELCVLDQRTPPLPELVARIGAHLGVPVPNRLVSTRLLRAVPSVLTGIEPETLTFLTEDSYDTATAEAHNRAMGITMPSFDTTLERWVTYLVSTRFGAADAAKPARFVDAAGSRTYCVGDPERAEAVFLHGIPWDGESWHEVVSLLDLPAATPDLPGLGRSSAAEGDFVAWLGALLGSRREPVSLIGHSLGSEVAVRYAHAFPDRVSVLVLVSPFFLQARPAWYLRMPAITSRAFSRGSAETMQRQLIGARAGLHPATASAHAQLRRRGVAARTAGALASAAHPGRREELRTLLSELRIPVLLVHGEGDPLVAEAPEGVDVALVSAAGHNPQVSRPKETAAAIRAWVARKLGSVERKPVNRPRLHPRG
jgi:nucleoside-diphosphate-sugar epimerase/pimeloyl-ACP methyl ester carboxylesterase